MPNTHLPTFHSAAAKEIALVIRIDDFLQSLFGKNLSLIGKCYIFRLSVRSNLDESGSYETLPLLQIQNRSENERS